MPEIVNLNKARKAKIKQKEIVKAQENRVIYGLSTKVRKMEKDRQALERAKWSKNRLSPDNNNKGG